jgi:hypothetical protein
MERFGAILMYVPCDESTRWFREDTKGARIKAALYCLAKCKDGIKTPLTGNWLSWRGRQRSGHGGRKTSTETLGTALVPCRKRFAARLT